MPRRHVSAVALAHVVFAVVVVAAGCGRAGTGEAPANGAVRPLAPPGLPADSFPAPSRPVADIVTDTWSDEDTRDRAGEAERVMRLLEVRPGMAVADVGAGSGYYTTRVSRAVGPAGRVYAQDIVPAYLARLEERVRREGLGNVTLALGEPHDPRLPAGSADLALLVHMYHEVEQPYAFLANLRRALRPGARVAVVDLDRATNRHGTPTALLRCEFEAVGFRQTALHDLGAASGYLAVFTAAGEMPRPSAIRPCSVDGAVGESRGTRQLHGSSAHRRPAAEDVTQPAVRPAEEEG